MKANERIHRANLRITSAVYEVRDSFLKSFMKEFRNKAYRNTLPSFDYIKKMFEEFILEASRAVIVKAVRCLGDIASEYEKEILNASPERVKYLEKRLTEMSNLIREHLLKKVEFRILETIEKMGAISVDELNELFNVKRVKTYLKKLKKSGYIEIENNVAKFIKAPWSF
ncbi:MAG: MarR family transcriptional regulator [Candidatus Odinarchaeia archaeon]